VHDTTLWPNWYKGNPFRAARDRMMAANPPASLGAAQAAPATDAAASAKP
jgi:hypothetical protein